MAFVCCSFFGGGGGGRGVCLLFFFFGGGGGEGWAWRLSVVLFFWGGGGGYYSPPLLLFLINQSISPFLSPLPPQQTHDDDSTSYSTVTQSRETLPTVVGARVWACQYMPAMSTYVPLYVSNELPAAYTTGSLFKVGGSVGG